MSIDDGVEAFNNGGKRKANRSTSEDKTMDMTETIGLRLVIDETIELRGNVNKKME